MSPTDPTVTAPKKLMTADEFWEYCQRPENENRWLELIRGELVEWSRPVKRQGVVAVTVANHLFRYSEMVKRGYGTLAVGVILGRDPDTVRGLDAGYFTDAESFRDLPPKWDGDPPVVAVVVLSPDDKPSKVNAKVADYLHGGVKLVWLVDYEERKVTVYRPDRTLVVLDEASDLTGDAELPGFRCRIADFFRLPGEQPTSADRPTPPPSA